MSGISRSLPSLLLAAAMSVAALPVLGAECKPLARFTSLDLKTVFGGRPGIDVTISGVPKVFLVDTGGVTSMLEKRTVQELKLPTAPARKFTLTGVNGVKMDTTVRIPSIVIGNLPPQSPTFFVRPDDGSIPQRGAFDGVLAPDFLRTFDIDFDFSARKLNLFSPDHCEGKVVYWQAPVVAIVPIQIDNAGHITFQAELDGHKIGAMLDTGASSTNLNLTTAQRVFNVDVNAPDVEKIGELKGGYSAAEYHRRFKALAIGGVTVTNPDLVLLPDLVSGNNPTSQTGSLFREEKGLPSIILGMTELKKLHIYIAYKERKLYVTEAAPVAPAPVEPAAVARNPNAPFCPAPTDAPSGAIPSIPAIADGMAAFRNGNAQLAYAHLKPLADKGIAEAERDLGIVLRQGCRSSGNATSAAFWLQKAAATGDIPASAQLGDMYEYGDGVMKDGAKALPLLKVAADAGQQVAMADMGEMYFTGNGIAEDHYQGVVWSVKAAEKGAPLALFRLGREYAQGVALPKDNAKAALYMTVGIQRLQPGRRNEFQPALDEVIKQLPKDAAGKAQQSAKAWMPGDGVLAEVITDADKKRGH